MTLIVICSADIMFQCVNKRYKAEEANVQIAKVYSLEMDADDKQL
jgi:hypothetical protein